MPTTRSPYKDIKQAEPEATPYIVAALRRLARHRLHVVRAVVARHPYCPQPTLAMLARDPHPDIRALAAIKLTDAELLSDILLRDPHPRVRRYADINPHRSSL